MNGSTFRILQFFTGHIAESFTLREISRRLGKQVSFIHRAIKPLLDVGIIELDKHKNLFLNYKVHSETLAYAEYLRRDEFFEKFKDIKLLKDDVVEKIEEDNFILIIFGSAVESDKPRDIDILLIVDSNDKIEFHEKFLSNITSNYGLPFEERVISNESVYEMLLRRDEKNIMNEILNKHVLLYGAELFYRLLERGR
jgi:hypothetical protein